MIREAAERFADQFLTVDDLAALATERVAVRAKAAGVSACEGCGIHLIGYRGDATACSSRCRKKR